jgi:hypothetical protein
MIIRVILIALILITVVWFLSHQSSTRRQAGGKLAGILLMIFAVLAVLFPDSTTTVAHKVGVGRGADLLLYCVTIAFLVSLLSAYLYRQDDKLQVERLARKMAILQANQDVRNERILKKLS